MPSRAGIRLLTVLVADAGVYLVASCDLPLRKSVQEIIQMINRWQGSNKIIFDSCKNGPVKKLYQTWVLSVFL